MLEPTICEAQQNLFNIPSGDITDENKFFFQQQFNVFTAVSGTSNTTLDYGLGHELEVGINIFNIDINATNGLYQNPHVLLNFQKGFTLSENYKVSFGTQTGITAPVYNSLIEMPSFSYITSSMDFKRWGKYYLGSYYTNQAYAGQSAFGLMAGIDYPLIENKLNLMADFISGSSDISVAVIGAVLFLPHHWHLSLGAQLPAPGSNNDYGMVIEITKL